MMEEVWAESQGLIFTKIVVSRESLASSDPWEVIDSMSDFAGRAHRIGGLRSDELAPEVLWSSQLTRYMSQVNQNGHYTYVGNNGWKDRNVAACRSAIAACGMTQVANIYADLSELVNRTEILPDHYNERYSEIIRNEAAYRPFRNLDDRFFKIPEASMLDARVNWLLNLPDVLIVPEDELNSAISKLTEHNPLRAARLAALADQEQKEREAAEPIERTRFASADQIKHANEALGVLRRPFRRDPKEVLPAYWDMDGGFAFPLDVDDDEWFLLIIPSKAQAMLLRDGEPISGPKAMPKAAAAFFTSA